MRVVEEVAEISSIQEGLLLHSGHGISGDDTGAYVMQMCCMLRGDLDLKTFDLAWKRVTQHQPVLRSAFQVRSMETPQQVVERAVSLAWTREDWRRRSDPSRRAHLESWLREDRTRGFDLAAPPLWRLALLRVAEDRSWFIWTHHHALLDGWSVAIVLQQVLAAYEALRGEEQLVLPPVFSCTEAAACLRVRDAEASQSWWRERLQGVEVGPSPWGVARIGRRRPGDDADPHGEVEVRVGVDRVAALRSLTRREQLTMATIVQAAWAWAIGRYSTQREVVFGWTLALRPDELAGAASTAGLFINTVPVRVSVAADQTMLELFRALRDWQGTLQEHARLPLAEINQLGGQGHASPLFETILAYESFPVDPSLERGPRGLDVSDATVKGYTHYPIAGVVLPGASMILRIQHDRRVVSETVALGVLAHIAAFLHAASEGGSLRLGELSPPPATKSTSVAGPTPREASAFVHEMFEAQARATPDAIAVEHGPDQMTYRAIDRRANQLACVLLEAGVRPESRVALMLPLAPEALIAVLACLKAGAAYTPLDAHAPRSRNTGILDSLRADVLLTLSANEDFPVPASVQLIAIDREHERIEVLSNKSLGIRLHPDGLCAVLHTSGSTGSPKRTGICHRGLAAYVAWSSRAYALEEGRGSPVQSPLTFDFTATALFAPLVTGKTVCFPLLAEGQAAPQVRALDALCEELGDWSGYSMLKLTPAHLQVLLQRIGPRRLASSAHTIVLGGEQLIARDLGALFEARPDVVVVNEYGPTEAVVGCCVHRVTQHSLVEDRVPIGIPVAGVSLTLLDRQGRSCPDGGMGELAIGGKSLARGYLEQPSHTAERFRPDPDGGAGERVYRSGDRARQLESGDFVFLGRHDDQIKLRGHRIEPGELEVALRGHRQVEDAVVALVGAGSADPRLVAYTTGGVGAKELRRHLRSLLPAEMLPQAYVEMTSFPLSVHGKLDRSSLPVPPSESRVVTKPRNELERRLAVIWSSVLQLEDVGITEDFLALGGHSLLAARVINRVREDFGARLTLGDLLEAGNVATLAEIVRERATEDAIEVPPATQRIPDSPKNAGAVDALLSPAQERLYFLDRISGGTPAYHTVLAARVIGPLAVPVLRDCFDALAVRHEVLRAKFRLVDGRPVQGILEPLGAAFVTVDLSDRPALGRERKAHALLQEEVRRPFDLVEGPPFRVWLAKLNQGEHLLCTTIHHIVCDGWSRDVLLRELSMIYNGRERLPTAPRYADYVRWYRERVGEQELEEGLCWWERTLESAVPTTITPDWPRRTVARHRGATRPFQVPPELSSKLVARGRKEGTTVQVTLLTAFSALLRRYAGTRDVVLGVPVANRSQRGFPAKQLESMVGPLVNTVVLRVPVDGRPTLRGLMGRVRDAVAHAWENQHVPFESVVERIAPDRDLSRSPLYQVLFDFQVLDAPENISCGLIFQPLHLDTGASKCDLELYLWQDASGELGGALHYDTDLYRQETADRILSHFRNLLWVLASEPATAVQDAPMLSPDEWVSVVHSCNDAAVFVEPAKCLHEWVWSQARSTPDAIAVSFEEQSLTYRELMKSARELAKRLRRHGAATETVVAVEMERSLEMVVALLATLESGAAYTPIDPQWPSRRKDSIMREAAPCLVLVAEDRADASERPTAVPRISVCSKQEFSLESADTGLTIRCHPDHPAYVIFTSGTSGRPKGVVISHRAISNRLRWMQRAFGLRLGERVLHKTPTSFDVSLWELFWPLISGAQVVLAPPGAQRDPGLLVRTIAKGRVTTVHFVPSLLPEFLEKAMLSDCTSLARVICSGEALTPALRDRFFQRLDADLFNLYGPTECSVDVTWHRCSREDGADVPIGLPVDNTRLTVVDADGAPVPEGVPGELQIAGIPLARGYLGQPRLTAEVFVPDDLAPEPGSRRYRSGDLCKRRRDGAVDYLGRIDGQLKIRGVRIEPAEVETMLLDRFGLREVAVIADGATPRERRLIAYIVPEDEPSAPASDDLRRALEQEFPAQWVPSMFVILDSLPRLSSGKMDRAALPRPTGARPALQVEYSPPRTGEEQLLAEQWQEVLDCERVGVDDDFFALGGDSIRSLQVVNLARESGLEITLEQLFLHRTIVAILAATRSTTRAIESPSPFALIPEEDRSRLPTGAEDAYPMTALQEGMVFHASEQAGAYHNVDTVHVRASFEPGSLQRAIDDLVAAHPVLRTAFLLSGYSEPIQVVHARVSAPLEVYDLRRLDAAEQDERIRAWFENERIRPFDVAQPPLIRFQVHIRSEDSFQLTLPHHHGILDGWSLATLCAALVERVEGDGDGSANESGESGGGLPFSAYVSLERAARRDEASLAFWREELADAPAMEVSSKSESAPGIYRTTLPLPMGEELRKLARDSRVPLKSVLLAAWCRALGHEQGSTVVVSGVVTDGRMEGAGGDGGLGLFLNSLPLRLNLCGGSWNELARRAFEAERRLLPHRHVPLTEIQRQIGGRAPFGVLFNFTHFHKLEEIVHVEVVEQRSHTRTSFELTCNLNQDIGANGRLELAIEYGGSQWNAHAVERLGSTLLRVLEAMVRDASVMQDQHDLLEKDERLALTGSWSGADEPESSFGDSCLHELIWEQARKTPDAVALVSGDVQVSYRTLRRKAELLASVLKEKGVGRETCVGIQMERTSELVVALLGVLEAGGAYVPLDCAWPEARRAFVERETGAILTLRADDVRRALRSPAMPRRPRLRPGPSNLAYVLYTSGSTGTPKGVAITHASALALMRWTQRAFTTSELAGVCASTSISFDLSVFELFGPLTSGGTVVLVDDALEIPACPQRDRITMLNTVPSAASTALEVGGIPASVSTICLAGEPLSRRLADALHSCGHLDRVWNLYGPTEDTTYSTGARISPHESGNPLIGGPVAGARAWVVDSLGRLVPPGVLGTLWLGGTGLARGYFDRPGLTADAFRPDAFGGRPGARVYRTGDRVRFRDSGALAYLGRGDGQVKLRGHRIELGEVESALNERSDTVECAAALRNEDTPGGARLLAWVVRTRGQEGDLREYVRDRLPSIFVPSAIFEVEALPRLPNGKLNRNALIVSTRDERANVTRVARTPVEEELAGLWAELFDELPGPQDDFFSMGGHSLLAMRLVARIRLVFGVDLSVRALLAEPTIGAISERIQLLRRGGETADLVEVPHLRRSDGRSPAPLSFAQEGLWYLAQLRPNSVAYNLLLAVRIEGTLESSAMEGALHDLTLRHDALRSRFFAVDGRPMQEVIPLDTRVPMQVEEVSTTADPIAAARAVITRESSRPFDLSVGPPLHSLLIRCGASEHVIVLRLHHIVADGWSVLLLAKELHALLMGRIDGRSSPLPERPFQMADHARWQRSWLTDVRLERDLEYWRERLGDALDRLPLPTDHPRDEARTGRAGVCRVPVPPRLLRTVKAFAQGEGATEFLIWLAGIHALIGRLSGAKDVCIGTPAANRTPAETEGICGCLLNTVVIRVYGGGSFRQLVQRTKEASLDAWEHLDVPFERIVRELQPERDPRRTPFFDVFFGGVPRLPQFDSFFGRKSASSLRDKRAGSTLHPFVADPVEAKFELSFALTPQPGRGMELELEYEAELFDAETISRLAMDQLLLLERALAQPDVDLKEFELKIGATAPAEEAPTRCKMESPPPDTASEKLMASMWRRILCLEFVSRNDEFFKLGGSSLQVVQFLHALGKESAHGLRPRDLYESSLAELAARHDAMPPN
jgi:amino acid adenylation domain-containing protein